MNLYKVLWIFVVRIMDISKFYQTYGSFTSSKHITNGRFLGKSI